MSDQSIQTDEGMMVSVRAGFDPSSDLWMVSGPYWFTGEAQDEEGCYSVLIEGEADAMQHARELAAEVDGCGIKVYPKTAWVPA